MMSTKFHTVLVIKDGKHRQLANPFGKQLKNRELFRHFFKLLE